ncbi:helix-turn-helix domain-containing protein [Endozoicomonadaceae bacterium StTr2]
MEKKQALIQQIAQALVRERRKTGCSIAEIARRAGIAKSTLSQLEAGNGNPSIETLWALSVALNIPFARLIEHRQAEVQVIRRGEGVSVTSDQADYEAFLLSTCPATARRDLYLLCVQPGEPRLSEPHNAGVIEHLVITQGRALVGLEDNAVELAAGDYITYPADERHIFKALEPDTMALLISEHN